MEDFSQILNFIDESLQSQTAFMNQQSLLQQEKDLSEEEKKWSEQMLDKQNAWNMAMWKATNEYNAPSEQVQRLRDAGLNPLYYGLDGTSANAMQSAQPLGYERASVRGISNPTIGIETKMALKSLEKDIELKNAQIDKLGQESTGIGLDNQWKDMTMEARAQAEELKNSLTKEQIAKIGQERKNMEQELKKLIAETDNEIEKKLLIQAQTNLAKMQEKEIAEMLPYQKLLIQAQTEAQKAAAAASFAHAAYERGLIDSGYIDAMADEMKARAKNQEQIGAINEWKSALKHGNMWSTETGNVLQDKVFAPFMNGLFSAVSILGECITGPIAGVFK